MLIVGDVDPVAVLVVVVDAACLPDGVGPEALDLVHGVRFHGELAGEIAQRGPEP
jgi:hypothetical protein